MTQKMEAVVNYRFPSKETKYSITLIVLYFLALTYLTTSDSARQAKRKPMKIIDIFGSKMTDNIF